MRDDRLNAAVAIVAALDLDGSICANALICVWENRFSKAALYSRHPPGLLGPGDCNRGVQADEKGKNHGRVLRVQGLQQVRNRCVQTVLPHYRPGGKP